MNIIGFPIIDKNISQVRPTEKKQFSVEKNLDKGQQQKIVQPQIIKNNNQGLNLKEVLSNDELEMLGRLFPDGKKIVNQDNTYNLNRQKVPAKQIGSLVDVKS